MTVRYQTYTPNSILYAADIQQTADNGIVEISAVSELSSVGSEVNLVFCKENYEIYKRIAEGLGAEGVVWEAFSSGAGAATISSPAPTGQYTDGDGTWDYWEFTASGSLTVDDNGSGLGGFADVLIVGGAGGGGVNGGGGGAGGVLRVDNAYLPAGSLPVYVGVGGAAGTKIGVYGGQTGQNGFPSMLAGYIAPGGGGGGSFGYDRSPDYAYNGYGLNGGSGGGGGKTIIGGSGGGAGGAGVSGLGHDGGTSSSAGGGGGAGGPGSGSTGGPGITDTITGTSQTYGTGANAGSGAGASGIVIVRVRTA